MLNFKRLLCAVLAGVFVFSMLPAMDVSAADSAEEEYYLLNEDFGQETDFTHWQIKNGSYQVSDSGELVLTPNSGANAIMWYNGAESQNWTDYEVTVNMNTPAERGKILGFIFRSNSDASKYYILRFVNGVCQIYAGSTQLKSTSTSRGLDGNEHEMKIIVKGNEIAFYLDGGDPFFSTFTDNSFGSGTVGFLAYGADLTCNSIQVKDLREEHTVTWVVDGKTTSRPT